jgi:hypothetical protein
MPKKKGESVASYIFRSVFMSDEIAYIGRNLNARTIKAVEGFQVEVSRIQGEAAGAGALHGSRTFISFWQAGLAILEREMLSAMDETSHAKRETPRCVSSAAGRQMAGEG